MIIHKKYLNLILFHVIAILAVACNKDSFIDDEEEIDGERHAIIEGDGGEASFKIRTKGLERIQIDNFSNSAGYTYYNEKGDEIPEDSPASEIARINFTGIKLIYDVFVEGNRLSIRSTENCISNDINDINDINETIRLEYKNSVELIPVTILRGTPIQLVRLSYDSEDIKITNNAKIERRSIKVNNNGPLPLGIEIKPYQAINAPAIVEPDESWAKYEYVNMRYPVFNKGLWTMSEEADFRLATIFYVSVDRKLSVPVFVPANSNVEVVTSVSFALGEMGGSMLFRNPVSGRENSTRFICKVLQPVNYDIEIKDVE